MARLALQVGGPPGGVGRAWSGRVGAMPARCTAAPRSSWPGPALSAAVGGQLARRDQLRGLLGAYRAKVDPWGWPKTPSSRRGSPRREICSPLRRATSKQRSMRCRTIWTRRAGRAGPGWGGVVNRCDRPGCDGEIIDGYCDVAGHRAPDSGPSRTPNPCAGPAGHRGGPGGCVSSPVLHRHDCRRRLLQRVRIGTARRGAWCRLPRRDQHRRGTPPATAASRSRSRRLRSAPVQAFSRDRVVEHTGDEHRPTGGRRDEHRRRLDRTYRFVRQSRAPGCRSGGHALGARTRPASRGPGRTPRSPSASGSAAGATTPSGGPEASGRPGPRASAPIAGLPIPSPRSCGRVISSAASTWSRGASPTVGWDGSISPRTRTSRTPGWCSRACSTPATRPPWRRRQPRSGSWPRSITPTSSGSRTSSNTTARATSSWGTSAASRSATCGCGT